MKKFSTIILLSLISVCFVVCAYKNLITSQKNMCVKIETTELISKIEGQESFVIFSIKRIVFLVSKLLLYLMSIFRRQGKIYTH